jgi:phasin
MHDPLKSGDMIQPKFEVPAELRSMAEKTIDQTDKAFGLAFRSCEQVDGIGHTSGNGIIEKGLSLTEQNMKAAFNNARKIAHATDLQEAMQIQAEFLKSQFTNAGDQMKQISDAVMSATKDVTEGNFKVGGSN